MITALKEVLIYNASAALNLNNLNAEIKSKIDKIFRVNPITGSSYQIWSPNNGILQFSSLNCGEIYIIESNSTEYNISDNLIIYDTNLCSPFALTPTATSTSTPTSTPTITKTPTRTPTPTPTTITPIIYNISGPQWINAGQRNNISIDRNRIYTFSVNVTYSPSNLILTYQWQKEIGNYYTWSNISNSNSNSYSTSYNAIGGTGDTVSLRCIVSANNGTLSRTSGVGGFSTYQY